MYRVIYKNRLPFGAIPVKGLCQKINIVLKAYNINLVLSVNVLMVFKNLCILVDEKIKLKVLACSFAITY
jgi:hypothetical protein